MQTPMPVDQLSGCRMGEYHIERLLAHGKSGTAYIAKREGFEQSVVMTIFSLPEMFLDRYGRAFLTRFSQENQRVTRLRHPLILPLYAYGQYGSYPYIVSSLVKGKSLAQILKQQERFTPQQIIYVLNQVATAIDYIHSQGLIHGLISSTSILLDEDQQVQLASIGLRSILEMYGIERLHYPYDHLYSVTGSFLGTPEYLAPECAQEGPLTGSSDVYSLGIVAFEMLTGRRPFVGKDHLDTVLARVKYPASSLQAIDPEIPLALDRIVQKALLRDPVQRYQSAGEMIAALQEALQSGRNVRSEPLKVTESEQGQWAQKAQSSQKKHIDVTLPPTINWFDDEPNIKQIGEGIPATAMGYLSSIDASAGRIPAQKRNPEAEKVRLKKEDERAFLAQVYGEDDPFQLLPTVSARMEAQQPMVRQEGSGRVATSGKGKSGKKAGVKKGRRKVVALLVAGGVIAVGGGLALEERRLQVQAMQQQLTAPTTGTQGSAHQDMTTNQKASAPSGAKTTQKTTSPARNSGKSTQSAAPVQHTGTTIGSTTLAANSSKTFTNPADGNDSLLIHLPNGNFVAAERACTHQGVAVNYNTTTQKLVCPLHGAIFDPTNNFAVLQGPATLPLKALTTHVYSDGTITVA